MIEELECTPAMFCRQSQHLRNRKMHTPAAFIMIGLGLVVFFSTFSTIQVAPLIDSSETLRTSSVAKEPILAASLGNVDAQIFGLRLDAI